ncbi:DUF4384 domain-containing protein [uncultured Cohaesibacter sp.]|uniref:DUF4384 domain-containing protein n=1 Tax=uncultured Cohaesibacter sp. TaxID=1002546 RepID=UPI00292F0FE4|nr:DUF4384 domain-containing protein [uncultured Cohaesibacter sp.]
MLALLRISVLSILGLCTLLAIEPARAGIVEANIDAAVFDLVDNLRKSDVSRIGVEMSDTHRDYINDSDRKRILSLVERFLSQQSEQKFEVISRTSTKQAQRESQNNNQSFSDFVDQQSIDTVIRLNTYDYQGGLKFNLEAAPYGQTKLISASEQYLLIDSVQDLNRFSPQRAMHIVSKELAQYLFDRADYSYSTPFSVKAEDENLKSSDKLTTYLKNLVLSELSVMWEGRYEQPGIQALDDGVQGQIEVGPWGLDVSADVHDKGISVTVALIRDGFRQTNRFIEIDKSQVDPGLLRPTINPFFTQNSRPVHTEELKPSDTPFLATGKAVIGAELVEQEALTAAKLLARARAISTALNLDPPKIGLVRRSQEIPRLIGYLNEGLPYDESVSVEKGENVVEVTVRMKVQPLFHNDDVTARIKSPVLLSGDPLQISVMSEKSLYFGLFGWQADGTVIRIFPFRHRDKIRLYEKRPTILPSKPFGLDELTSMPLEGAQSNHEALVLITSSRPMDLGRLAKRVARKNENWQKRGHRDSQFFSMLSLQVQAAPKGTSILFVPYQVVDRKP